MHERTITSRTTYRGRIVQIDELEIETETGIRSIREIVRHRPAVAIWIRTSAGTFVLIRQFRKPVEQIMIEVVAGVKEPGEESLAAARRELREETGYEAVKLAPLGMIYPSPGYVDEQIDVFLADVTGPAGQQSLDHDERVELMTVSADEFRALIAAGRIHDSKTLAAWTLFQAHAG